MAYHSRTAGLLLAGALALAPLAAQATNIVANGGFETGDFTGWTQTGNTSFDGVQCPGPGPAVAAGNCSAFFGPVGSNGGITQNLSTVAGNAYQVDFDVLFDGGTPSFFSATFGGQTLISLTNPPAHGWEQFTFVGVDAGGPSTALAFNFRDDPGFIFFDAVSVNIPEPGSLALFGTALLGLFGVRRRRSVKPS